MKRLIVYFSLEKETEKRETFFTQLTGVDLSIFPDSLKTDPFILLLGDVESKMDKNQLLNRFQRKGNLVVLVPKSIKKHITEICDKKESRLQKNHTSSVTLIESIEVELKRLLVDKIIAESSEQITFDEVIEFEFIQEEQRSTTEFTEEEQKEISNRTKMPLEQITFDNVKEFINKCQTTRSYWTKVAAVTMSISLVSILGSVIWSKEQLRQLEKKLEQRFEIGISEIEIAASRQPNVSQYIQIAIDEMAAAEKYLAEKEKSEQCTIKIKEKEHFPDLGITEENMGTVFSIKENLKAIMPIKNINITLPKNICAKIEKDRK